MTKRGFYAGLAVLAVALALVVGLEVLNDMRGVRATDDYSPYPYATDLTTGTQVSSTYEGRHITILESELYFCTDYDGHALVVKGDPCLIGSGGAALNQIEDYSTYGLVGVAFNSAAAATDYIALDTEGIWNLPVYSTATIYLGNRIFFRLGDGRLTTTNTVTYPAVPFGWALADHIGRTTAPYVIPVKVHSD